MTEFNYLPELVRHHRLDADFKYGRTVHRLLSTRQGSLRKETWMRKKKIGNGAYGEVWLEKRIQDHQNTSDIAELRAVKCIHASLPRREYGRELEAMATFSSNKFKYNDFFVQFYGWFESTEWLHAVMEYCEYGDLRDYLRNHGKLPEEEAQDIARQLLTGVSLMHKAGFAHRDIKPANIFVKSAPPDHWWVKLGDLGLSKRAEAVTGSTTVRATPGFIPPELYGFTREDPKRADPFYSDMWCLAETVFRILTDQQAFDSPVKLSDYVGCPTLFPEKALNEAKTSESGIAFIRSLMAPFPSGRMTAEQALKHPWIYVDEDVMSDGDEMANAQDNTTVASSSSDRDEYITQPTASWTSDVDTANTEPLSKLSIKGDKVEEHTIQDEEQPIPLKPAKTVHLASEQQERKRESRRKQRTGDKIRAKLKLYLERDMGKSRAKKSSSPKKQSNSLNRDKSTKQREKSNSIDSVLGEEKYREKMALAASYMEKIRSKTSKTSPSPTTGVPTLSSAYPDPNEKWAPKRRASSNGKYTKDEPLIVKVPEPDEAHPEMVSPSSTRPT